MVNIIAIIVKMITLKIITKPKPNYPIIAVLKMLNKQKGNMYGFVTHTWNPIKGKCSHDCSYCYMKFYKQKPLHLVEKELEDDLGSGNFIFVGSSTDMFADDVPREWILKVLSHCNKYPNNKYLFQTKNTRRYADFIGSYPMDNILGTTLESNRSYIQFSKAPDLGARISYMNWDNTMVTIEPIMDFDLIPFIQIINQIKPKWVNIGADSKGHKLPEPSEEKIRSLINQLRQFTEVKLKPNLARLCPTEDIIAVKKH